MEGTYLCNERTAIGSPEDLGLLREVFYQDREALGFPHCVGRG